MSYVPISHDGVRLPFKGQFAVAAKIAGKAPGAIQPSILTLYGTTPGAGAGESVELLVGGTDQFILENGKAYHFYMSTLIAGTIAGTKYAKVVFMDILLKKDAGLTTLVGASVGAGHSGIDDGAPTSVWTMASSIGVGPDRFVYTFSTGASTAQCEVNATIRMAEAAF